LNKKNLLGAYHLLLEQRDKQKTIPLKERAGEEEGYGSHTSYNFKKI